MDRLTTTDSLYLTFGKTHNGFNAFLLAATKLSEIQSDASRERSEALAARQRGERAAALEHFRAAAALDPHNLWTLLDIAAELRELGRNVDADAVYRDVVAKKPDAPQGWRGLGAMARLRGNRTEALHHFRTAADLEPEHFWTLVDIATELRELGRLGEAEAAYRNIVTKNPSFSNGWRGLALLARQRGDRAAALEHFRAAVAADPDNVWTLQDLSTELRELGHVEEAAAAYRDLTAKHPHSPHGWRGLALLARQRGDRAGALEYFRAAAALDPHNIWTMQDMAAELRELGRPDEAQDLVKDFAGRHPESAQAQIAYANGIRHKASASEIIDLIEKAVAVEPGNLHARLALAGEYLKSWRLDEADALYDAALAEKPGDSSALAGKGQVARRRGQCDVALERLEAAAADPAASEWTIVELSRELLDAGRLDAAQQVLRAALARNPQKPIFHLQLGHNARASGDRAEARTAYMRAAEVEGGQDQARIELAVEEFHEGRLEPAFLLLDAVLQKNPKHAQALTTLANIAQQLDDVHGAIALRRKALGIDPGNLWSRAQLIQALAKVGKSREADEELARCEISFGPLPEFVVVKARILTDRGDHAAARALLEHAAARFPNRFELHFLRVMSLISCGAFDEARRAADGAPAYGAREKARLCLLRGQVAAAEWRLESAYSFFAEALQAEPIDPWTNDCAARVALLRGDVETARSHLETSVRNNPVHRSQQRGGWKSSQTHIGQLLDEYRMDPWVLDRLRKCMGAGDCVEALAKLVLEAPDSTPAAISLLIAMRRKGLFSRPQPGQGGPSRIPAKITQFWDEDIPKDVEALCDGWRATHPDFEYTRFSKADARLYLREMGPPGALAAFDRAAEPAMKADIFRLALLYREGGFYIDADDRCLAPISTIDPGDRDLILYQEDFGTAANNFIGVIPRHPAIGLALQSAVEAINRGDSDVVWLATGPGLLTRCVAFYLAEAIEARLGAILFLDRHEIFEAVAIHCVTAYKHSKKHWSRTSFSRSRAFSLASLGLALEAEPLPPF